MEVQTRILHKPRVSTESECLSSELVMFNLLITHPMHHCTSYTLYTAHGLKLQSFIDSDYCVALH